MTISRRTFAATGAGVFGGLSGLGLRTREESIQIASPAPAGALHLTLAGPASAVLNLDPALVRDNQTMTIVRQLYRGLLEFDATLTLRPALAESVTADAEERVFTVVLREGIAFHDGRPILAGDVEASFARALKPATAGGDVTALAARGQLAGIDGSAHVLSGEATRLAGIEVVDDRHLTITLTEPDSAFMGKLASVAASIVDTGSDSTSLANGTGPFALSGTTSADSLTMTNRNSRYIGPGTVSKLSFITGDSAAMPGNLLQAGSIDLATGIPADQARLLADPANGGRDVELVSIPEFSLLYLALSPNEAPLSDIHIRRAIQCGFPWTRLAEAAGAGVQPAQGIVAPGMLGRDWNATMPEHDIERARSEIARSVYGSAERVPPITIYTGQTSLSDPLRNVGVALQEHLGAELGLRIEPISVAWGDFLSGLPAGRFPTYSLTWIADFPDPSAFLHVLFGSDSPDNYTGYQSPKFDALIAEALSTSDEASRVSLFSRAQQVLIDDAVVIPISFDIGYTAYRTGIGGVPVSPIGLVGLESIRST